jgi:cytochrome P450
VIIGFPHATTEDDFFHGRFIPKGTCVIPNITALHSDPEMYPNPETFEPDRFKEHFLDVNVSTTQVDHHHQRDHFNYGFGRRACPGIHIAEQNLFIVISRVLWAFDLKVKPGHPLDMNSKSGWLALFYGLILQLMMRHRWCDHVPETLRDEHRESRTNFLENHQ